MKKNAKAARILFTTATKVLLVAVGMLGYWASGQALTVAAAVALVTSVALGLGLLFLGIMLDPETVDSRVAAKRPPKKSRPKVKGRTSGKEE